MIKHVLLKAVLTEMDRVAAKLQGLVQDKPDEWQELYASYRRQIGLCITEMVKLAQDDLAMSDEDDARLRSVFDAYRESIAAHQARFPVEAIALDDPGYVLSFGRVHDAFGSFKRVMTDLAERYDVAPELVT